MTVFFDVDTQIDFMFPSGALYVPGAERILPRVSALNRFAESRRIPVISTTDAHSENDSEFRSWPAHCVAGTVGRTKPVSTLLDGRVVVPTKPATVNLPAPQIIVEKTVFDMFSNQNLPLILDTLHSDRYVVYGVVTEICVRCALWGLLKRDRAQIQLVTDAVQSLKPAEAEAMIAEFTQAGGHLTTSGEVLASA